MNFPITVLKGAFKDIRGTIEKIMYYAIYKHSLMYDFGDEAKNMKASADFYRVGLSDIETSIRYGREIYESIKKDTPSVSIDIEMLCSYYNTPKTEAEIACFALSVQLKAYWAIKHTQRQTKA